MKLGRRRNYHKGQTVGGLVSIVSCVKAVVATFNKEKALVGAFSEIVKHL